MSRATGTYAMQRPDHLAHVDIDRLLQNGRWSVHVCRAAAEYRNSLYQPARRAINGHDWRKGRFGASHLQVAQ